MTSYGCNSSNDAAEMSRQTETVFFQNEDPYSDKGPSSVKKEINYESPLSVNCLVSLFHNMFSQQWSLYLTFQNHFQLSTIKTSTTLMTDGSSSHILWVVFTTRYYATVVYAIILCLSVCLSHAGIVSRWLNIESWKRCCTIAQGLWFSFCQRSCWNSNWVTPTWTQNVSQVG